MMEEEEVTKHPSFAKIRFSRLTVTVATYSGVRYSIS